MNMPNCLYDEVPFDCCPKVMAIVYNSSNDILDRKRLGLIEHVLGKTFVWTSGIE